MTVKIMCIFLVLSLYCKILQFCRICRILYRVGCTIHRHNLQFIFGHSECISSFAAFLVVVLFCYFSHFKNCLIFFMVCLYSGCQRNYYYFFLFFIYLFVFFCCFFFQRRKSKGALQARVESVRDFRPNSVSVMHGSRDDIIKGNFELAKYSSGTGRKKSGNKKYL